MVRQIELSQGYVALVDDEDYGELSRWKWSASLHHISKVGEVSVYAVRSYIEDGKYHRVYLHRQIMLPPAGLVVDHVNGDTLDNTRTNLRITTKSGNGRNKSKKTLGTSSHIGVSYRKDTGKWRARVQYRGPSGHRVEVCLYFLTEEEAIAGRERLAREYYGEYNRAVDL